jgi:hypothetical protein
MVTAEHTTLHDAIATATVLREDLDSYRLNVVTGRIDRDDDWEAELAARIARLERPHGLHAAVAPDRAVIEAEPEAELLTLF